MKQTALFIILIFISINLKAQNDFQQLTLGAGAGAATAYASSSINKTTPAFNANLCFYPKPFFDIDLESQIGELAGGQVGVRGANFTNNYQAVILEPVLQFGAFFSNPSNTSFFNLEGDFTHNSDNDFLNICENFYVGSGFGLIHNSVTNVYVTTCHSHDITPVVPVKFGYAFNFVDHDNNPLMKINLSYSFNSTIGRGLDGYYGSVPQAPESYAYYSLQVEIPINFAQSHRRSKAF
jgi:hypothetical protein